MESLYNKSSGSFLDKVARPHVVVFNRPWQSFQVCGYTGLALAILLAMTLIILLGLSPWIIIGLIVVAIMTFLGLAMVTKIITGKERLIYYHHEISIMMTATIFLKVIDQPILPYLDITILGIGSFLVCGRVGCLMAGCCHGRPHKWGVCYRKEHVDAGFTNYYEGVRLFPIQAVESVWVLFVVVIGVAVILTQQPPGQTLAWYIFAYGTGRVTFEFARGDPGRPYYCGFSEGQWLSVILMCAAVWGEMVGTLPLHLWHVIVTVGIVLSLISVALIRRFRPTAKHKLLNPRHIGEVAEAVDKISRMPTENITLPAYYTAPVTIHMSSTSLGIQISAGKIKDAEKSIDYYGISSQNDTMSEDTAGILTDLIIQLKYPGYSKELITDNRGVFHLFVSPLNRGDET